MCTANSILFLKLRCFGTISWWLCARAAPSPTVTSVSPSEILWQTTVNITIHGANFRSHISRSLVPTAFRPQRAFPPRHGVFPRRRVMRGPCPGAQHAVL